MEVKNLDTKESYMIHERVVRDSVWLRMTSKDDKTRTCSYSKLSGFGHTIYGKRLTYKEILPNKCAVIKNIKVLDCTSVYTKILVCIFLAKKFVKNANRFFYYY